MTFLNCEYEILAFCYEGKTELSVVKDIVKKHLPTLGQKELTQAVEKSLKNLINNEKLTFTKSSDKGYIFDITSLGENIIEDHFMKSGNEQFIKTL